MSRLIDLTPAEKRFLDDALAEAERVKGKKLNRPDRFIVLNPVEIMTDTAGTSDIIFGLFWLLGYQFSPRLAEAGHHPCFRTHPLSAEKLTPIRTGTGDHGSGTRQQDAIFA